MPSKYYLNLWRRETRILLSFFTFLFYLILISMFFSETLLIHSLLPGIGFVSVFGINFLKSDLFFFVFTLISIYIIFIIYSLYNYLTKTRFKKINRSVNIDWDRSYLHSQLRYKKLLIFFIIFIITTSVYGFIQVFLPIPITFLITALILKFIMNIGVGIANFSTFLLLLNLMMLHRKDLVDVGKINFWDNSYFYLLILSIAQVIFLLLTILTLIKL